LPPAAAKYPSIVDRSAWLDYNIRIATPLSGFLAFPYVMEADEIRGSGSDEPTSLTHMS
jgi:hypothetical protein